MPLRYQSVRLTQFEDGTICIGTFNGFLHNSMRAHLGLSQSDGNIVAYSVEHLGRNEFNVHLRAVPQHERNLDDDETVFGPPNAKHWRYGHGVEYIGEDLYVDTRATLGYYKEDITFHNGIMRLRNPEIQVRGETAEQNRPKEKEQSKGVRTVEPLGQDLLERIVQDYNRTYNEKMKPDNMRRIHYFMSSMGYVHKGATSAANFRTALEVHGFAPPHENRIEKIYDALSREGVL